MLKHQQPDASSSAERRIVVYGGETLSEATTEAIEELAAQMPHARILVVHAGKPAKGPLEQLRDKLARLRREPVSYPLEIALSACSMVFGARPGPHPDDKIKLPELSAIPNVWHAEFDQLDHESTQQAIRKFDPWLGISLGIETLPKEVFGIPQRGTINLHKSKLPEYRGGPPGFWELHDQSNETGVSVHWLDEALERPFEGGEIIAQKTLRIPPYSTPLGLAAELDNVAVSLLHEAVLTLDNQSAVRLAAVVPRTKARTRPPLLLRRRVERMCRKKRAEQRGILGTIGAFILRQRQRAYIHLWAPLRNLLRGSRGQNHTAILVYHRISDQFRDKVSLGIEQFVQQLEELKRHYDVLSMEAWLAQRGKPRKRPAVLLSFDDGYECNYLAARLCRRAGVPACFFVCTGIVGSENPFLHDLRQIGVRVPALSWDECREMADWGFDIASHSVFHSKLGEVDAREALDEVETAKRHLRDQLGKKARDRWFAFPFGRPEDIQQEVLDGLERAGVEVAFATAGGSNTQNFDLRNVRRMQVNATLDLIGLRAMIEGWKLDQGPAH